MPADTSMAFVIIQHLSPNYKSVMDELLARRTAMPVCIAEDRMLVRPNALYLLPPKKEMIIAGGRLLLTDKDDEHKPPLTTICQNRSTGGR
jgi:two-component system CheB/CheR fusion protein